MLSKKPKIVGILGGMGPFATAMFYHRILELTPAKKDWDHLRVVIDSHPHIPSRTRHFLYNEESPVPGMLAACKQLENYPVDFIAIPCNSACYFLDQFVGQIQIPVLNIIEITASSIGASKARCAVLGGRVTFATRSYEKFLKMSGNDYVAHSEEIQKDVEDLIERVKTNQVSSDLQLRYESLLRNLRRELDINLVILGCTELTFFKQIEGLRTVDSSFELARAVVKEARSVIQ